MFYEGDIQSGISQAIQQSKHVVCFVRDNGPESAQWENEWLKDDSLSSVLQRRAVTFRIHTGSQDAAFLAPFFPIAPVPTVIVTYQGRQIGQLFAAGTNRNSFTIRLLQLLNSKTPLQSQPLSIPSSQQPTTVTTTQAPQRAPAQPQQDQPKTAREIADEVRQAGQDVLPSTSTPAHTPTPIRSAAEQSHAQEHLQKKREAKQERDRIRKQIENDKIERRQRELDRKAQEHNITSALPTVPKQSTSSTQHTCSLQIRLLDGSTKRANFPATSILRDTVRPWIASATDSPFTVKLICTPQPSRPLSDADEALSLKDLGLLPSATLVLVPIQRYTSAYDSSAHSVMGVARSVAYRYIFACFDLIARLVNALFGLITRHDAPPPRPQTDGAHDDAPTATTTGIRIRTLRDRAEAEEEKQFYNGNQTNFQPNKPDEGDEG